MKIKTLKTYFFCAISGLFTAISFSVAELCFFCFFSLIPLLYIYFEDEKFSPKLIFVYNMFYYIPLTFWLFELYPLTAFGIDEVYSFFLLILSIILIGISQSVLMLLAFLPINAILANNIFQHKSMKIILFSILYILGESFQEIAGNIAFPWGRLGVILFEYKPFIQSASLFGTLFLSLLILLINAYLALTIFNMVKKQSKSNLSSLVFCGTAILIFTLNSCYGLIKMSPEKSNENDIEIVIVQGNLASTDKWQASVYETLELYFSLSEAVIGPDTEMVVWPETAVPTIVTVDIHEKIKTFTSKHNVVLVTGAFESVRRNQNYIEYNAMKAFFSDGTVSHPYYKQKLVPFGEYVPLSGLFGNLMSGVSLNLTPGTEPSVISVKQGDIGGLICYESIFPRIVRRTVNTGAEAVILLSNDSWFGASPAIRQHFGHSVLRAVECGRYVVRAGNTGISAIITPSGKIKSATVPFTSGAFTGTFNFIGEPTLYSILGDIILLPSYGVYLLGFFLFFKSKIKNKRKSMGDNVT